MKHQHPVQLLCFSPAVLEADASEVQCRRRVVRCQAWLARVWVSARVVRGIITDAKGRGNSGRRGQGEDSFGVIRPGVLVNSFHLCVVAVVVCVLLAMALGLSTRATMAAAIVWFFLFERAGLLS